MQRENVFPSPTLEFRYWSHVDVRGPDECWPWTAGLNAGYGCFSIDSGSFGSHRVAKFLATGINPSDCVLHKCDNRKCCNPNHLFDGTLQDNVVDMEAREVRLVSNFEGRAIGGEAVWFGRVEVKELGYDLADGTELDQEFLLAFDRVVE